MQTQQFLALRLFQHLNNVNAPQRKMPSPRFQTKVITFVTSLLVVQIKGNKGIESCKIVIKNELMSNLNFMCFDHISGINDLIKRRKPPKQTLDYNVSSIQ